MKKIFLIFLFTLLAQLILLSKTVTYGEKMAKLQEKISSFDNENQDLELLIATKTSYLVLEEQGRLFSLLTSVDQRKNESIALGR